MSTRILALGQSAACIWPFSITLKKGLAARQRLGVNPCSLGHRGHRSRCPLCLTLRSTRMTVNVRSAQRPPDWTHGRPVAALALRPNRPTSSPAAAPAARPQGRVLAVPSARSRLVGPGGARDPLPRRSPASARSPPDLNGGHQAGPAAVSSQRSPGRKKLRLRTLRASSGPPIRKDRPIP